MPSRATNGKCQPPRNTAAKTALEVTTAMYSAKKNIAYASLHMPWGRPGDELWAEIYYQRELKWYKVMARCHVTEQPFWDPARKRTTPAADF